MFHPKGAARAFPSVTITQPDWKYFKNLRYRMEGGDEEGMVYITGIGGCEVPPLWA